MCRCLSQTERKQVWGKIITWHLSALNLISEGYLQTPFDKIVSQAQDERLGEVKIHDLIFFVVLSLFIPFPPPHNRTSVINGLSSLKRQLLWKSKTLAISNEHENARHQLPNLPEGVSIIIASFRRLTCQNARITPELGDFHDRQCKACV